MMEKLTQDGIGQNLPERYATLGGLVSRYSPSGSEAAAVDWLIWRMTDLGFSETCKDAAGNAVGHLGDGEKQLVLLGHIDTVPGEIPVRLVDGVLFGRGAVDAKGPLACFVDAAARVGVRAGWKFTVVGCVEEERNSDGARYAADQFKPTAAIVGEPSGWNRITLGYKGSSRLRIRADLPRAHPAGPAESACDRVLNAVVSLHTLARKLNVNHPRRFDQIQVSTRAMESGESEVDEWAQLEIDTRLPLWISPEEWMVYLNEHFAGVDAEIAPMGTSIPVYRAEKNSVLVRAFLSSIRQHGGKPGFVVKTGTADLNIVAPVWNCPALVYGPGDSTFDHTPDEQIALEEYDRGVSVLATALEMISAS